MGEKEKVKKKTKEKQGRPTQRSRLGLKALIRWVRVGGKRESKKRNKRKARQTHPAQWMGLKALITGLGVGGKRESKKESKMKREKQKCDYKSKETKKALLHLNHKQIHILIDWHSFQCFLIKRYF